MNLKSKLSYKTFKIKLLKILKTNVSKREKWKKQNPIPNAQNLSCKIYEIHTSTKLNLSWW